MSETLLDNLNSGRKKSKINKLISYCAVCESRLPPGAIFCPDCDPPLPPGEEPEETGISFGQALLRIGILVILFVAIVIGRLDFSFDRLFSGKQMNGVLETLPANEQPQDNDFQTVHIVIVPLANIRSKPSIGGNIVLVAEQGMNLEVIEGNEDWSKVRVLGKTGWISNQLFKSEILAPE